jgi:MYXO-CTERM domain-containing protein
VRRRQIQTTLAAALAALVFLLPGTSVADVVSPAPASCPEGSMPRSGHVGPHCRPLECSSAADCGDNDVCREASLCQEQVHGASRGGPITVWSVVGPCVEGSCTDGGTCKTAKYCMDPPKPEATPAFAPEQPTAADEADAEPDELVRKKPGCSTVAAAPGAGLGLLLVAAAFTVRRRRAALR